MFSRLFSAINGAQYQKPSSNSNILSTSTSAGKTYISCPLSLLPDILGLQLMFQILSGADWNGHGGHFPEPACGPRVRLTCKQRGLSPQPVSVKQSPAEWTGRTRWLNKEKTHRDSHTETHSQV